MEWINELLFGNGIAHSLLILSITIALGIQLGKLKLFGVSLGVTLVLFIGIALAHFGMRIDPTLLHFFKEFGLILFVFSVGMQVGPGFFASFRQGGVTLNLLATGVILLGVVTTLAIHYTTGVPMSTMVGIMSGAVTNTPGLGAAQQAFSELFGSSGETIAQGYAVAYPLGVVGIILSMIFVRYAFGINLKKEEEQILNEDEVNLHSAIPISLVVSNPAIFGKTINEISYLLKHREFVVSRLLNSRTQQVEVATSETILNGEDRIFVITTEQDAKTIKALIGEAVDMDRKQWIPADSDLISRRILVTKPEINGKRLGGLQLRHLYGVNITRVHRAGVDLVASPQLNLQIGDRLTIVGSEPAVKKVETILGNSLKRLNEPNLFTIFLGIGLGILLGSIPFAFPGIPQPVKLGLAGGPLIVAILISRFGYKYKLITYTTQSANLMLREVGITIFLACVGLSAGEGFIDTIVNKGGYMWILYGFLITVIPLLIIGTIGRFVCKLNYFTLIGLLAGSTTDPPALAFANSTANNDAPAVGYATVYPITMFLRVLSAQLLILIYYA